jgi:hypothetical protein
MKPVPNRNGDLAVAVAAVAVAVGVTAAGIENLGGSAVSSKYAKGIIGI